MKETGSEANDSDLFVRLCTEFLHQKPTVIKSARLGKPSKSTNKRLLLVSLGSVEAVNSILAEARHLRNAHEPYVKSNVFINRYLTKEEAKASFERRQGRRAKAAADAVPATSSAATAATAAVAMAAPGTHALNNASQTAVSSTLPPPGTHDAPRSSAVQGDSSSGVPATSAAHASGPSGQSTTPLQGPGLPRPGSSLWSDDVDERQGAAT